MKHSPRQPVRLDAVTLALLVLPPLFWAGNAIVGRLSVGVLAPMMFSLLRWIVAAFILAPFAAATLWRHRKTVATHWRMIALLGVLGVGCYNSLQYIALQTSGPVNVTLIASSGPIFSLLIGAVLFAERVTARRLAGAAISMCGVFWVMLQGDIARLARIEIASGDWIMLIATAAWSLYTWLLMRHRPDMPLPALLLVQILTGIVAIAPFALLEVLYGTSTTTWNSEAGWMVLYVAVFPSLAAYFCWDRSVARAGAQLPVYFVNLTPVFAAMLSVLLLGEAPRADHAVGLALILAGIYIARKR